MFKQQRHAKCAERGGARTGVENRWARGAAVNLELVDNGDAKARPDLHEALSATFGNASAERGNKSEWEKTVTTQKIKI